MKKPTPRRERATPALELAFVSLFVDDLARARQTYERALGVRPDAVIAPIPAAHPFSPKPPVVFTLGRMRLALFQADLAVTQEGDVGLGLLCDHPATLLSRAARAGCEVVISPRPATSPLSLLVTPDRHFFELLPRAAAGPAGGRRPRKQRRPAQRARPTPTR